MNPPPSPSDIRLEELMEVYFRNGLSDAGKAEFAGLLDASAEARRRFVEMAGFEAVLTGIHHRLPSPSGALGGRTSARFHWGWSALPWLALAACLVVGFWLWRVDSPVPHFTRGQSQITARLVNEAKSVFADGRSPMDAEFGPGSYELKEGMIHLRFISGADLVIEAPARFDIFDSMRTRLHWGQVRSIVPPTAKGFTIATEGVDFEDIGTEFGLRVERGTGTSAMHVFDGQVNVRNPDSGALMASVLSGVSVAYRHGVPEPQGALSPEEFIAPGNIGLQRWKSQSEESLHDPGLIGFFPFSRDARQSTLLRNIARVGGITNGTIHGAQWVSGRWAGKDALLFDRLTDFAELEVLGDFDELTVAVWVLIDRLDHTYAGLFNSNGWEPGDLHMLVQRSGFPYTDLCDNAPYGSGKAFGTALPMGQWCHIAAVVSLPSFTAKVYVNGSLVYDRPVQKEALLRPGLCRIGNWLPRGEYEPLRSLNGRIDELGIWKRALSQKELQIHVERGRPDFLWSGNK